ncbi:MAG TPA: SDR family oxidoreductase [Clostridiales bacterium]|nr:SDR family oxidoreductase [Clostridiales bacterium]
MYPNYPPLGTETVCSERAIAFPPQHQNVQPGVEAEMTPRPIFDNPDVHGSGKLNGRAAIITGGDSGIGRAVAVAFAKEGADLAIIYRNETQDAQETQAYLAKLGRKCVLLEGDITDPQFCKQSVENAVSSLGHLDILVNNAAVQYPQDCLSKISDEQLELTFRTNVFSMFYLTRAALPHLQQGASIINTASVTAYEGNKTLIDYSATKGAIVSFTRALAANLAEKKVRVNAVAPGPVWTPLIVASFPPEQVKSFGSDVPLKRASQPFEIAPAYVYLASDDSVCVTGQVLHVNGGTPVES